MRKIFKVLVSALLYISIIISNIFIISTAIYKTPNIAGYTTVQVMSSSMKNSHIDKGDVRVIKLGNKYDFTIGDIIAFKQDDIIIYHEIIDKTGEAFITKGSSNKYPDAKLVYRDDILGKQAIDHDFSFIFNTTGHIIFITLVYFNVIYYSTFMIKDIILEDKQKVNQSTKRNKSKAFIPLIIFTLITTNLMPVYCYSSNRLLVTSKFEINNSWQDIMLLPEETKEQCRDFHFILDHPDSDEGKAFLNAVANKHFGTDYVGNMDSKTSVITNLDNAIEVPDNCTYVIKLRDNGYDLYITYENLNDYFYGSYVNPIYKTSYQYNANTDDYEVISSAVGKAMRNIYYIFDPSPCFDTETFISIK